MVIFPGYILPYYIIYFLLFCMKATNSDSCAEVQETYTHSLRQHITSDFVQEDVATANITSNVSELPQLKTDREPLIDRNNVHMPMPAKYQTRYRTADQTPLSRGQNEADLSGVDVGSTSSKSRVAERSPTSSVPSYTDWNCQTETSVEQTDSRGTIGYHIRRRSYQPASLGNRTGFTIDNAQESNHHQSSQATRTRITPPHQVS